MKKNNILEDGVKPRVRRVKLPVDTLEKFFTQSLSSLVFRTAKVRSRLCLYDSIDCPEKRYFDSFNTRPTEADLSEGLEMPKPGCLLCRLKRAVRR
jgi:hypothetical protein